MTALQAAVLLVSQKTTDLLKIETSVTSSRQAELVSLRSELERLMCFLKDAAEKQETADQRFRHFVMESEEILYEADEALDYASRSRGECIKTIFKKFCPFGLFFSSPEVNKITISKDQVRTIIKNLELYGIKKTTILDSVTSNPPANEQVLQAQVQLSHRCRVENSLVGLKDDAKNLVSILVNKEQDQTCCIIAICGMEGIGKTTLAKSLYNDHEVRRHFEGFAWAKVARNFQTRNVLEDIFLQLVPETEEEIMNSSTIELVQQLFEVQLSKKFLIVLDDVRDKDAWKCLNLAFPSEKTASKLIVTTRSREVAEEISDGGFAYTMRTLKEEESWELFVEKASLGGDPGEMQEIGKNLVNKCNGLPLAIILLGNLLGRKHTLHEWKVVHQHIEWHASAELGSQEFSKIPSALALNNYHDLPHYLKPCFLYLGLFPEDSKIELEKLYLLWIAEGLIPSTTEKGRIKMDIAECYLDELVKRNMVQVQEEKEPTCSLSKTVYLHKRMRYLCVSKGKDENFTEVMDLGVSNQPRSCNPTARRLAQYFDKMEGKRGEVRKIDMIVPPHKRSLSLLLLNGNQHQRDMTFPLDMSSLRNLGSLRILHLDRLEFGTGKPLKGIDNLMSLRYLSLNQCYLLELPSSIGNLCYLEILDLRVQSSCRINMPNVLGRIKRLKHLYLPLHFWLHRNEKLRLDSLKNLETLQNFDASLCNAKDLIKLTKLRRSKVTTEGNLDDLEVIANHLRNVPERLCTQSSLNVRNINCYSEREHTILRNLFQCPTLYNIHIEGHIGGNLARMISPSLTELVLSGTELDEDPMATLQKFPRLWILDLNNDAFLGKQMVCSASGFPRLSLLKLSNLQNLENLSIEKGAMPNLSTLAIQRCKRLEVVPEGFNHLRSLQKLKIVKCNLEPGIERRGKSSDVWNLPTNKNDGWD